MSAIRKCTAVHNLLLTLVVFDCDRGQCKVELQRAVTLQNGREKLLMIGDWTLDFCQLFTTLVEVCFIATRESFEG